jgi:hypothetical protein
MLLGIGLCAGGIILALVFYFAVKIVPLSATGISAAMIGFACINIARTQPRFPSEFSELLLNTGMETAAGLLEELGLSNRAIYLPSTMRDGTPQALIPVKSDNEIQLVKDNIPGQLLVRYGDGPDSAGIVVTTPGSKIIDMLERKPEPTSTEIESAISYILVGVLDIANSVTVFITDNRVDIEIGGLTLGHEDNRYYRCLGSPAASIAATITGEALQRPVRIQEEIRDRDKIRISIEVLP